MPDPASNPSPRSDTNAYPEDPAVQRPMDGSAIKEIVAKSGIAQRPAPVLRHTDGKFVKGSGRKS
jgi:hypothetical protein